MSRTNWLGFRKRPDTWVMQLMTIASKGGEARKAGIPRDRNPYWSGVASRRGVQGQRMMAWDEGWDAADQMIREEMQ